MTVRELLQRVDSAELTEWMAWYRLNPCGEEVICAQIALAVAAYANAQVKKGGKQFQVSDFYIVDKMKPKRRQTELAMKDYCRNMVKMMGGEIKRG